MRYENLTRAEEAWIEGHEILAGLANALLKQVGSRCRVKGGEPLELSECGVEWFQGQVITEAAQKLERLRSDLVANLRGIETTIDELPSFGVRGGVVNQVDWPDDVRPWKIGDWPLRADKSGWNPDSLAAELTAVIECTLRELREYPGRRRAFVAAMERNATIWRVWFDVELGTPIDRLRL